MNNNKLKYMMSNDPNDTISQKSSNVRKKIRPFFLTILKLGNKLKLIVEKNEAQNIKGPVIYVASHGFKDDVLNTILTIKDDAYVVFGNIDLFYNTFDGLCLWIYGTQLVDRYNKESRNSMKDKMNKIIEYGNNVIIFSEATWNLSPNRLMENLHWGFYDIALKNDALVVPVLTHKVGKKCFSRVLKPIDMKNIEQDDCEKIKKIMSEYVQKTIDINIYGGDVFNEIKSLTLSLKDKIDSLSLTDLKDSINQIQKIEQEASTIVNRINEYNIENNDDIKNSAFDLIKKLLCRISTATKEIMVSKVRNVMAFEKYDLYDKHPDYTYMTNGKNQYDAWEDYLNDTIKATPYFYPEPEKTTLYKDPLIKDECEVMPWLEYKKLIKRKK